MFKNILSSIKQQKLSATLNICSLAISLTITYLILSNYYFYEHWNQGIKDYKRIYRVDTRIDSDTWTAFLKKELQERLKAGSPHVESCLIFDRRGAFTPIEFPGNEEASGSLFAITATEENLSTLSVNFVADSRDKIINGNGIAIARSYAQKMNIEPGDDAIIRGKSCTVEAIFEDFPDNSDFDVNRLICSPQIANIASRSESNGNLYIKLRNTDDHRLFLESAAAIIANMDGDEYKKVGSANIHEHLRLVRLDRTKETQDLDAYAGFTMPAQRGYFWSLWAIAITLLSIAFINYFNFFVALIPRRIRNINICKVMGAERSSIAIELLFESVLLVSVSLALSLLLIDTLPEELIGKTVTASEKLYTYTILTLISIAAAIATAAYPAWYVTSFPPAFVLKGSFAAGTSGRVIRNTLLGLQYVVSFLFIILALAQYSHFISLKKRDIGFDKDFYVYSFNTYTHQQDEYAAALKKCEAVEDVTFHWGRPLIDYYATEIHSMNLDKKMSLNYQSVAHNYTQFMEIEIIEGRNFSDNEDGDKFIITESVKEKYGVQIGDCLSDNNSTYSEVIGVCRNFTSAPLSSVVAPSVLHYKKNNNLSGVYFKLADGYTLTDVAPHIEKLRQEFDPKQKRAQIEHFDDIFKIAHEGIIYSAYTFALFALVAVAVALLGVFGMVFFETQHRRKEIAIRRVNGATRGNILRQLTQRYLKIIGICYIIAAPITIAIILADGSTSESTTPLIFVIAFIAVALLTFAIVAASSWKALNENPSEVISKG